MSEELFKDCVVDNSATKKTQCVKLTHKKCKVRLLPIHSFTSFATGYAIGRMMMDDRLPKQGLFYKPTEKRPLQPHKK